MTHSDTAAMPVLPAPAFVDSDALTDAARWFADEYAPTIDASDTIALNEAWNNYTDALCKDGTLTDWEYDQAPSWEDIDADAPVQIPDELDSLIHRKDVRLSLEAVDRRDDAVSSTWEHDGPHWARPLHFRYVLDVRGEPKRSGYYSCGMGHLPSYVHRFGAGPKLDEAHAMERERETWTPDPYDVVAGLLMDCAFDPELTFREWCSESCMEWENPADALDVYEAIRETRSTMRTAFGSDLERAIELAQER